ncbi:MAG: nicotinamide-nucleotide amidohydrolase family protein [Bacillota bacterium]|nr:nicotinamide-nucleotide amidohydrolase family protein [Bacillota bacterium]
MTSEAFLQLLKDENCDIEKLNDTLLGLLKDKNMKIATAESCTGGMVSKWITDVPGAATVFDLGICCYANEMKEKVLGVSHKTLENFGAVSHQTAEEMADGVREISNADIGVSTTGIAGPDGGTAEKPIGLVYIGISTQDKTVTHELHFGDNDENNRDDIRRLTTAAVFYLALRHIKANF